MCFLLCFISMASRLNHRPYTLPSQRYVLWSCKISKYVLKLSLPTKRRIYEDSQKQNMYVLLHYLYRIISYTASHASSMSPQSTTTFLVHQRIKQVPLQASQHFSNVQISGFIFLLTVFIRRGFGTFGIQQYVLGPASNDLQLHIGRPPTTLRSLPLPHDLLFNNAIGYRYTRTYGLNYSNVCTVLEITNEGDKQLNR